MYYNGQNKPLLLDLTGLLEVGVLLVLFSVKSSLCQRQLIAWVFDAIDFLRIEVLALDSLHSTYCFMKVFILCHRETAGWSVIHVM